MTAEIVKLPIEYRNDGPWPEFLHMYARHMYPSKAEWLPALLHYSQEGTITQEVYEATIDAMRGISEWLEQNEGMAGWHKGKMEQWREMTGAVLGEAA